MFSAPGKVTTSSLADSATSACRGQPPPGTATCSSLYYFTSCSLVFNFSAILCRGCLIGGKSHPDPIEAVSGESVGWLCDCRDGRAVEGRGKVAGDSERKGETRRKDMMEMAMDGPQESFQVTILSGNCKGRRKWMTKKTQRMWMTERVNETKEESCQ